MHLWVAMLLSCRLAQVCQLSSDEEDSDRDTKDGLSQEEQQVLLGAVTVLAFHHLKCQEHSPQEQQLDHLRDMGMGLGTAGSAVKSGTALLMALWCKRQLLDI